MPYPLSKLPYCLQCRLYDLAAPCDAYQLQTAAGFERVHFMKPIHLHRVIHQPELCVQLLRHHIFRLRNVKLSLNPTHALSFKTRKITFEGINPSYQFQNWDYSLFHEASADELTLRSCTLDLKVLTDISNKGLSNITTLNIESCKVNLSLFAILKLFPSVKTLTIRDGTTSSNLSWVTDILRAKPTDLTTLNLYIDFANYVNFDPEDLLKLIKAQNSDFQITFITLTPAASDKVLAHLHPYFRNDPQCRTKPAVSWNVRDDKFVQYSIRCYPVDE